MKEIICYRNEKIVLKAHFYVRDENLGLMLKNKVIFYQREDNLGSTEFVYLDNFDRVIINDCVYSEMINLLNNEAEIIKEDKKIEEDKKINKIQKYQLLFPEGCLRDEEVAEAIEELQDKINELIDKIEEMEK